jgi:hypothetical protein
MEDWDDPTEVTQLSAWKDEPLGGTQWTTSKTAPPKQEQRVKSSAGRRPAERNDAPHIVRRATSVPSILQTAGSSSWTNSATNSPKYEKRQHHHETQQLSVRGQDSPATKPPAEFTIDALRQRYVHVGPKLLTGLRQRKPRSASQESTRIWFSAGTFANDGRRETLRANKMAALSDASMLAPLGVSSPGALLLSAQEAKNSTSASTTQVAQAAHQYVVTQAMPVSRRSSQVQHSSTPTRRPSSSLESIACSKQSHTHTSSFDSNLSFLDGDDAAMLKGTSIFSVTLHVPHRRRMANDSRQIPSPTGEQQQHYNHDVGNHFFNYNACKDQASAASTSRANKNHSSDASTASPSRAKSRCAEASVHTMMSASGDNYNRSFENHNNCIIGEALAKHSSMNKSLVLPWSAHVGRRPSEALASDDMRHGRPRTESRNMSQRPESRNIRTLESKHVRPQSCMGAVLSPRRELSAVSLRSTDVREHHNEKKSMHKQLLGSMSTEERTRLVSQYMDMQEAGLRGSALPMKHAAPVFDAPKMSRKKSEIDQFSHNHDHRNDPGPHARSTVEVNGIHAHAQSTHDATDSSHAHAHAHVQFTHHVTDSSHAHAHAHASFKSPTAKELHSDSAAISHHDHVSMHAREFNENTDVTHTHPGYANVDVHHHHHHANGHHPDGNDHEVQHHSDENDAENCHQFTYVLHRCDSDSDYDTIDSAQGDRQTCLMVKNNQHQYHYASAAEQRRHSHSSHVHAPQHKHENHALKSYSTAPTHQQARAAIAISPAKNSNNPARKSSSSSRHTAPTPKTFTSVLPLYDRQYTPSELQCQKYTPSELKEGCSPAGSPQSASAVGRNRGHAYSSSALGTATCRPHTSIGITTARDPHVCSSTRVSSPMNFLAGDQKLGGRNTRENGDGGARVHNSLEGFLKEKNADSHRSSRNLDDDDDVRIRIQPRDVKFFHSRSCDVPSPSRSHGDVPSPSRSHGDVPSPSLSYDVPSPSRSYDVLSPVHSIAGETSSHASRASTLDTAYSK